MKLRNVEIVNFKSFENATMKILDNTTGIYGPNGSGKTSLVEALKLLKIYIGDLKVSELFTPDRIEKMINVKHETMKLSVEIEDEEFFYKYIVDFKRVNGEARVTEEQLLRKYKKKRQRYQMIAQMKNIDDDKLPMLYILRKKVQVEQEKDILFAFGNFKSYLALFFKKTQDGTQKYEEFYQTFGKVKEFFNNTTIIEMKDSALAHLSIAIPLQFHTNTFHTSIPLMLGNEYHRSEHVEYLEAAINQIDELFTILFPGSKLVLERDKKKFDEEGNEIVLLNLYILKKDKKISIEYESAGTIKLISILAALLEYVKNENSLVVIDELDAHIFEYLLNKLLLVSSKNPKGQLIFTAHNLYPLVSLSNKSVIFITENKNTNMSPKFTYITHQVSKSTNLRQKYLRAIAYGSEKNIEPFGINESAMELVFKKLGVE